MANIEQFRNILMPISGRVGKNIISRQGDYIGDDGLKHCGVCGKNKQIYLPIFENGRMINTDIIVNSLCDCDVKEEERKKKQQEFEEMRNRCFSGSKWYGFTFENDDHSGDPKPVHDARIYAENIEEMLKLNHSMVFYGECGVGKSFLLGCIANAVMKQGYSCLVTDFPTIVSQLYDAEKKDEYLKHLCGSYKLLLIDDLFTEQQKEYVLSTVWKVIEQRDKYGLPVVYSTNVTLDFVANYPTDAKKPVQKSIARICSRLRRARAVEYYGFDRRMTQYAEQNEKLKTLFGD